MNNMIEKTHHPVLRQSECGPGPAVLQSNNKTLHYIHLKRCLHTDLCESPV